VKKKMVIALCKYVATYSCCYIFGLPFTQQRKKLPIEDICILVLCLPELGFVPKVVPANELFDY